MHSSPETTVDGRRARLPELIGWLYAGIADQRLWTPFAEHVAAFFESRFCQLSIVNPWAGETELAVMTGVGYEQFKRYLEYAADDPRGKPAMQLVGKPIIDRELVDEAEFENSRIYRELLEPAGAHYSLFVSFYDGDKVCTLAVMRGKDRGIYTEEDRQLLGELVPHFRQAIRLFREFAKSNFERHIAGLTLDLVTVAILVVDAAGRVHYCNSAAKELLREADGLYLVGGRIAASLPSETNSLKESIRRLLAGAPHGENRAVVMNFTRAGRATPLIGSLSLLWDAHLEPDRFAVQQPFAALFVSDPEQPNETPPELLQRLYGLTPAEARLLAALLEGRSPAAAAEAFGVSASTVRSQMKSLFRKTNTHRQAELVRQVMGNSLWVRLGRKTGRASSNIPRSE